MVSTKVGKKNVQGESLEHDEGNLLGWNTKMVCQE